MIDQTVENALNEQIKNELYSAYLYLSMAAYFEAENLPGMAQWMKAQSQEEVDHGMKIFDFINERGGRVILGAIDQPSAEFESATAVFEQSLAHEKKVTAMIHDLYTLALEKQDYATQVMLQWFIEEQVEEEDNVGQVLEMVKMTGNKSWHLLSLDRQLGTREE